MGIISYLIIGTVFMATMDTFLATKNDRFTHLERILGITLWPIGLIMFVNETVKVFKDKRNGKNEK